GDGSLIALLMLGGIAVNHGVVMVDRIHQLCREGWTPRDAAAAAARSRLRPVLMTALTTIAGMLPMALSRGEGTEFQVPAALTVIGGLTTATPLTLLLVPVLALMAEERRPRGFRPAGPPLP